MNHLLKRGSVAVFGLGLAVTLAVPAANAATTTVIRAGDLNAVNSGTAGNGVLEFRADGVHLSVPDGATDYARGHFDVDGVSLADVHEVDYGWIGSSSKPGVYYDLDIDGDGRADGELIGESIYGGTDLWLNRDAEDGLPGTRTVPPGTFASLAPCNGSTQQNGAQDACGSSGAQYHGSIDDWTRSLAAAYRTPQLTVGGFVASGITGLDGILTQITYGPSTYTFSNAKETATVTAAAKKNPVPKGGTIKITGTVSPVGTGATATLQRKTANGFQDVTSVPVASDGSYTVTTPAGKAGTKKLRVVVGETSSTTAATSNVVKVEVVK